MFSTSKHPAPRDTSQPPDNQQALTDYGPASKQTQGVPVGFMSEPIFPPFDKKLF